MAERLTVEVVLDHRAAAQAAAAQRGAEYLKWLQDNQQLIQQTAVAIAPTSNATTPAQLRAEAEAAVREAERKERALGRRREFFSYEVQLAYRSGRRPWSRKGKFRRMLSAKVTEGWSDKSMDMVAGAANMAGQALAYADLARKIAPFLFGVLKEQLPDNMMGRWAAGWLDKTLDVVDAGMNAAGALGAGVEAGSSAMSAGAMVGLRPGATLEAGMQVGTQNAAVAMQRATLKSQLDRYNYTQLGRFGGRAGADALAAGQRVAAEAINQVTAAFRGGK